MLLLQALNGYMRQIFMCAFTMFWALGDGDAEKEGWFKLALYYYYVAKCWRVCLFVGLVAGRYQVVYCASLES